MSKPVPHTRACSQVMFSAFQEQCALLSLHFKAAACQLPLTKDSKQSLSYELSRLWMTAFNALGVYVSTSQAREIKSSLVEANRLAESVGIDPMDAISLEFADSFMNELITLPVQDIVPGRRSMKLFQIIAGAVGRDGVTKICVEKDGISGVTLNRPYLSRVMRSQINEHFVERGIFPIVSQS